MTAEQVVAVLTAATALLAALGAIFKQLSDLRQVAATNHTLINSRVGELLTATQLAALKEGELRGRDAAAPLPSIAQTEGADPFLLHRSGPPQREPDAPSGPPLLEKPTIQKPG